MAVLTRLVLVAVLVTSGSVQGTQLILNPDTIVGEEKDLTVQCSAQAEANDTVTAVRIFKDSTLLAEVDSTGVRVVGTDVLHRATATGSLTPPTAANLALTFNGTAFCIDKGSYVCESSSEQQSSARDTETLQARSDPSDIEMVVRPRMVIYQVNETVELICYGNLGNPAVSNWTWETRNDTFDSTWIPIDLNSTDETPALSGRCQRTGRSSLMFQVQMEDDNRMYRCYYKDPAFSANFTFQVDVADNAGSKVKGQTLGTGLAVWTLVTFLLTSGGQGHNQHSSTSMML